MDAVDFNIKLFDLHFKNAREGLKARGQIVDNPMLKLLSRYRVATDPKFVEYKKVPLYMNGVNLNEDTLV